MARFRLAPLLFVLLVACGHPNSATSTALPLAHEIQSSSASPVTVLHRATAFGTVKPVFERAKGLDLRTDSDFDAYIDPSVVGDDRELARKLMRSQPPSWRGDFIYYDHNTGRLISNNPSILKYVTITTGVEPVGGSSASSRTMAIVRGTQSASRQPMSFQDGCSPKDPYTGSGPYARFVSKCGFTSAIGFVNLACSTSQMNSSSDSGYMYFEVVNGPGGQSTEGGLNYLSDTYDPNNASTTGIAPYYRNSQTGAYTNLNANGFHYNCGQVITIAHGPVYGQNITYTFTGYPINYVPSLFWNGQQIQFANTAWEYDNDPTGWPVPTGSSVNDKAGYGTPCAVCSISEVTSIAQNGGDNNDGSTFGALTGGNGVHWQQVAFGNWKSNCYQGSPDQYCVLQDSPDYRVYYGGLDEYVGLSGNSDNVVEALGPLGTPYAPWESFVGIALPNSVYTASIRQPTSAFTAGSAMPPFCSADSYGYCYSTTMTYGSASCQTIHIVHGVPEYYQQPYTPSTVYAVYEPSTSTQLPVVTETVTKGNLCQVTSTSWNPSEPKVTYNDPNLP